MTTLYHPVLIESAEQAEALPEGTVAHSSEMDDSGDGMYWVAVKLGNVWARTDIADDLPWPGNAYMVDAVSPWTALVPIEAEEETRIDRPGMRGINPVRRLVTPWEEA